MDTTLWIGLGHEQVGIEKHSTQHMEEHCKIKSKSLEIPEGNLVLLHDHLEGLKKILDKYKNEEFVVVGKCPEPRVYCIKPVNCSGPEWIVNQCQLPRSWKNPK